MAAPTNISAATAIDITSLPYSNTQNVHDSGTTYTVWYKYTAPADGVIGVWGFGDLSVYRPTTRTRKILPTDPVYQSYQNRPTYLVVAAGVTYWFEIVPNGGNPTPANLTFSVELHVPQPVPIGSVAVVDTLVTYPIALLSADDGEVVLDYVFGPDIVGSEYGAAILPDGTLALGNSTQIAIYDKDYATIAFVVPSGGTRCRWIGSNNVDRFYISSGWPFDATPAVVWTCDSAGNQGPQTWTLGTDVDVRGLAPSQDETILYYIAQFDVDTNEPVKRWDLVNNVALLDLAPGIDTDTYMTSNLLCLPDGSVLVGYINDVAMTQFVRRYSAVGVVLNTYSIPYGMGGNSDLLAHGVDYTTFWMWLHDDNTLNSDQRFLEVRISDGTILKNLSAVAFDGGRYMYSETATPLARFGHSYSCPFWITRTSSIPPNNNLNGPGGLDILRAQGRLVSSPIRRVRITPHQFDKNQRVFYRRLELLTAPGQATVSGQGADPVIELHCSNDGGETYPIQRILTTGKLGEYRHRAYVNQLGMARDRVFKFISTDPVTSVWIGVDIEIVEGLN